jgi:hypothetical protein
MTDIDNKEITNVIDDIKPAPIQYTLETLPKLLPQQQIMLKHILDGNNYTDAYRLAGYSSEDHTGKAAWFLVTRNPLKAHLEYFRRELAKLITPEYLLTKLNTIADNATNVFNPLAINPDTAIKAIDVINKMQGNYAKNEGITINNLNTSLEDIRNARLEYKKDK